MKKTFTYQLTLIFLLVASCNFTGNRNDLETENIFMADSLLTSTGNTRLDSLLRIVATSSQDTNLARLYYDIGDEYFYYKRNLDIAKEYYLKTKTLSEKLKWNEGIFQYTRGISGYYQEIGLIDSAIIVNKDMLELAKREKNDQWIAVTLGNLGISYSKKGWPQSALECYLEVIPVFENLYDKYRVGHLYYLIGVVYEKLCLYDEQLLYSEKAIEIYNEKPDTLIRLGILFNYASALMRKREIDKAEFFLNESQRILTLYNYTNYLHLLYQYFADLEMIRYDFDKAEIYYQKKLEFVQELYATNDYNACLGLAQIELYKGNYKKAEEYANKALELVINIKMGEDKRRCYLVFSYIELARNNYSKSFYYRQIGDSIWNSQIATMAISNAKEMEAKYETEKKELKITALENEKRMMRTIFLLGGIVLLLILTFFIFLWRWNVQKKRNAEQQHQLAKIRIKQLEQEKQLVATQSLLEGETNERSRLARDLHDGLGGMLTNVKINMLEVKKDVVSEKTEMQHLDMAIELIDKSVREMRRVAHHLMPDTLSRFGLKPAIHDFCLSIPSVQFTYYGDESRINPQLEIIIYIAILELINNALKHANCKKIAVQIVQETDRISFNVQDDGCGFDPETVQEGMGMQNIRNRVAAYNGNIYIDSRLGEGTEVNVELRIEN